LRISTTACSSVIGVGYLGKYRMALVLARAWLELLALRT
jgi:hypothetical protein